MKKFLVTALLIITIFVITYLNLSLSRANQIESFLIESIESVDEDVLGITYMTALATTMELEQTFLLEEVFYHKQIDNNIIYAEVFLLVYTEGRDPIPKLVVFVQGLEFKDTSLKMNEFTKIEAKFVFNEQVIKDRINETFIDVTLSQLYNPNDQIFAIDSDYLFNQSQFNLNTIELIMYHNDIQYDVDMIQINANSSLKETLIVLRSLNNTETLKENVMLYNNTVVDEIYEDHVKFPVLNVIIEILIILSIYFLYQRLNLWYKKRHI